VVESHHEVPGLTGLQLPLPALHGALLPGARGKPAVQENHLVLHSPATDPGAEQGRIAPSRAAHPCHGPRWGRTGKGCSGQKALLRSAYTRYSETRRRHPCSDPHHFMVVHHGDADLEVPWHSGAVAPHPRAPLGPSRLAHRRGPKTHHADAEGGQPVCTAGGQGGGGRGQGEGEGVQSSREAHARRNAWVRVVKGRAGRGREGQGRCREGRAFHFFSFFFPDGELVTCRPRIRKARACAGCAAASPGALVLQHKGLLECRGSAGAPRTALAARTLRPHLSHLFLTPS